MRPENIANRRAVARGESVVFEKKADLIEHIVELSAQKGKNISAAQKARYDGMRRDQLEILISNLEGAVIPKKK